MTRLAIRATPRPPPSRSSDRLIAEPWQWFAIFAIAASIVVAVGVVLARSGDEIATRTGLGGLLTGMLLLSVATSLPELATDMSAALAGAPDGVLIIRDPTERTT